MAGVDVYITVEDITTKMATYTVIQLERSDTVGGTYALVATAALVAGQYYYPINDATGDINKWYRYRFYNSGTAAASDYSDPFQVDGVSRLRIRQEAMKKYGVGLIIAATTGCAADTFKTTDYRIASSLMRADRFKGSYIQPTTGTYAGLTRIVKASAVAAGILSLTVEPSWAGAPASGDEAELWNLAGPEVWNDAINRGLARYWFVDRIPLTGVADQEEYSLANIPWLIDKAQVHDVRWYPNSGVDVDESYMGNGRWWNLRQDQDAMTLAIYPTIQTTTTLYLECTRPMPPLYTDASVAPAICALELAAALAYDEVLAWLTRPGHGASDDRKEWKTTRAEHAYELHKLLVKHRPMPRYAPHRLPNPPVVPKPFSAR